MKRGQFIRWGMLACVLNVLLVVDLISSRALAQCFSDLSHLDSQLPNYPVAELENLRNQILNIDLQQALQTAEAQGFTPSTAAAAALEQAAAYDAARPQAEECIRQSATDPDEIIRALESGSYDFSAGGIPGACAQAYAVWYMGAIANRESAIGLACLAN